MGIPIACFFFNMFNCTCTRHIDWTTQTPSCIRQLRILSGLLCDKPWCNPIVLTTVAVGLGKRQFIQRQLSTPMFNCSASIPPLLLPLASSFLTLFILASAYGILTGVRRCFEDFDNISLSINQSQSFENNLNMFQTFWIIFVQAWIAATSPLLVSILGLNLLPAAFGIMTAGQVFAINRISVAICKPTNICSLTTVCKSLFFWHFMKTCFWLKLKTLWRLINILSKGVFAMLGPPLAGALVEAAGHRGPALQVHQIFLRIR